MGRMHFIFLMVFIFLGFGTAYSQEKAPRDGRINSNDWDQIHILEDTLGVLGYATLNDSADITRMAACHKLIPMLVKALKFENSFHYKFDRLHTISIQYAPDSSFRIFTWQLYVNKDDYRYFGAIQMNTPALKLFALSDRSMKVEDPENEILSPEKWYGSLYYNIREFKSGKEKKYLLFGYDAFSYWEKRKIIDVLSFKDGQPVFGAPVFVTKEPEKNFTKNRFVLQYSSEASARLNYDEEMKMIVYDHMEAMATERGVILVPDGTYEAYEYSKGVWKHIDKLENTIMDTPPIPMPVLDANKKDIFGKDKH